MVCSSPAFNISQLGFVFFFNFLSFFTLSALSQTIIEQVSRTNGISEHAGYYCGFLMYLIFTFGHFIATPIVEVITPKWSIVSGVVGYAVYIIAFLILNEPLLYFSAIFAGFTGSLLWTGQFDYLAQNSTVSTLDRNSSLLWGLSQISMIAGGIYLLIIYQITQNEDSEYDQSLINLIIGSLLLFTIISLAFALLLRRPVYEAEKLNISYLKHLEEIIKISCNKELLLLLSTFLYTGIELTFFIAVFPTMVSFTKQLGNNMNLNAVSSMSVGIGNVGGCIYLGYLGDRARTIGRSNIVLLSSLIHLSSFILIFISFPNESPLHPTDELSLIQPKPWMVIVCGIFLGIGDTLFNMQC